MMNFKTLQKRISNLKRGADNKFNAGYNNAVEDVLRLMDTEKNKEIVEKG